MFHLYVIHIHIFGFAKRLPRTSKQTKTYKQLLCYLIVDPGKYTFTPRLFHLSAQSGAFKAVEILNPARVTGVVMAMPFLQETLFSLSQPGN